MKLLVWDTSSKSGTIAAVEVPQGADPRQTPNVVSEFTLNVEATHSEKLLWGIHQVLAGSHWKLADIDVFGVGIGPGSFTGLRIGVTTARVLAHFLGKPLVGVSSLAALARPVVDSIVLRNAKEASKIWVVATTDACKGELFALFGTAEALRSYASPYLNSCQEIQERVIRPQELMQVLTEKVASAGYFVVVGNGRLRYPEYWNQLDLRKESMPFLESHHSLHQVIQGRFVAQLVGEALDAGIQTEPSQVFPCYLRLSDAELKLRSGQLQKILRSEL